MLDVTNRFIRTEYFSGWRGLSLVEGHDGLEAIHLLAASISAVEYVQSDGKS
jgi:hypothetical protein